MANNINRVPSGFLELLRAKVGGQTPLDWDSKLVPAMDMLDMYSSNGLGAESVTAASSGTGNTVRCTVSVPQDEFWRIYSVSMAVYAEDVTVVQNVTARLVIINTPYGNTAACRLAEVGYNKTATEYGMASAIWSPTTPMIVPGGVEFTVNSGTNVTNAVNVTYSLQVCYAKLNF